MTKELKDLEELVEIRKNLIREGAKAVGGLSNLAVKSKVSYKSLQDWMAGRRNPIAESCLKLQRGSNGIINAKELLPDYDWDSLDEMKVQ